MTNKISENNIFIKSLFFVFYIFIWGSIDTNFENSLDIFEEVSLTNAILFLRSTFFPFLFFFIIFIFFIKKKNKFKFTERKYYFSTYFLCFYFFFINPINKPFHIREQINIYILFLSVFFSINLYLFC